MELTAEQKLLKAFAINQTSGIARETLDYEATQLYDACEEYLDQFRDVKEKVESSLKKPEEGWLYKNIDNGAVVEMISVYDYGVVKIEYRGTGHVTDLPLDVFWKKFVPVAEPAWKPEVGKLYRRKLNGVITEVIKAFLDNREFSKVAHKLIGVNYDTCHAHCDYASGFLEEYEPIAELEGLKEGSIIYSETGQKWEIISENDETLSISGNGSLDVWIDGSLVNISGKQLFYRTADRAERFGRG